MVALQVLCGAKYDDGVKFHLLQQNSTHCLAVSWTQALIKFFSKPIIPHNLVPNAFALTLNIKVNTPIF